MPLLLCPNDNASMQTINRSGVEFDMCPTCRGVWLDRGELEKLLAEGRGAGAPPPVGAGYTTPPSRGYGEQGERGYGERGEGGYGERGEGGYGHGRRRGGLFDIFD